MTDANSTSKDKTNSVVSLTDFNSRTNLTEKGQICDEYNPFSQRDPEMSTSTSEALAHLLKSSLGSGILAMPIAFKNAGIIVGMVGTIIIGIICTYCVRMLVKTSHSVCRDARVPCLTFAETAGKVFEYGPKPLQRWAKFAKEFVDCSLMATYYAASCVYMVLIATSFHDVINYDCGINWDVRIYIAMVMIPCLFIGQIRSLKMLVPFSAMANIFILVTFGITLYYMFNQPLVISDKPYAASISQFPLFFATVIFAVEGIGAVMPVENSMRNPERFLSCPGVLNTAMIIVIALYAIIGLFGYIRFGDEVKGSITLNLAEGEPLADTAKILMALAIQFTYGLQFYIPNEILWRKISHKFDPKNHNISQILLRTGIILISGGVAAAIPNLEPFISLVGSIFFSLLGIFVPSLLETAYLWPNMGWGKWKLIKNVLLCILAFCALVAGSAISLEQIAKHGETSSPHHQLEKNRTKEL